MSGKIDGDVPSQPFLERDEGVIGTSIKGSSKVAESTIAKSNMGDKKTSFLCSKKQNLANTSILYKIRNIVSSTLIIIYSVFCSPIKVLGDIYRFAFSRVKPKEKFKSNLSDALLTKIKELILKDAKNISDELSIPERVVELPRDIKDFMLKESSKKEMNVFFLEVGKAAAAKAKEHDPINSLTIIGKNYYESLNFFSRSMHYLKSFGKIKEDYYRKTGKQNRALEYHGKSLVYYNENNKLLDFNGIKIIEGNFSVVKKYFIFISEQTT
jgi:hypothetical protein